MKYTTNYNLRKPEETDFYNIEDDNFNVDEIDAQIKKNADDIAGKVDEIEGKQLSTEDYTTIEKNKLANVEEKANNYVHPNDANTRHVTDSEKEKWNSYDSQLDEKISKGCTWGNLKGDVS